VGTQGDGRLQQGGHGDAVRRQGRAGAHLHHTGDAKLEVALGTVQRADDQVDDAQVEGLLVGVAALLLALDASHELLRLLVLRRHNVGDAQVGQDDRGHLQDGRGVLLDRRLVVTDRLLELGLLEEEDVRHVEHPHLVL